MPRGAEDEVRHSGIRHTQPDPGGLAVAGARHDGDVGPQTPRVGEVGSGTRVDCGTSSSIATFQVTWPIATVAIRFRGSIFTTRPGRS